MMGYERDLLISLFVYLLILLLLVAVAFVLHFYG